MDEFMDDVIDFIFDSLGDFIAAVISVVLLTWNFLMDWFGSRQKLLEADKQRLGVTVKDAVDSKNVRYIQGIFDPQSKRLIDGRVIQAEEVDTQVAEAHRKHNVVAYS